jgi:hypothetical protein
MLGRGTTPESVAGVAHRLDAHGKLFFMFAQELGALRDKMVQHEIDAVSRHDELMNVRRLHWGWLAFFGGCCFALVVLSAISVFR